MTALHPARRREQTSPPPVERIPFPTVDEVSRHCLQEEEPETVHIEVHLPGRPEPARLRAAFGEALRRHPRILMREAPGRWYRRRYEWELTPAPDVDPVSFPPPGPDALAHARVRALSACPPLSASPPLRLEVINTDGKKEEKRGDGNGRDGNGRRDSRGNPTGDGGGCVLLLTLNHTALDGPACLRVLATAAELYGGADNSPAPQPERPPGSVRAGSGPHLPAPSGSGWARPVRVAADAQGTATATGNGMLIAELAVPRRVPGGAGSAGSPGGSGGPPPYTVNDQLLVATSLMVARWNRLHDRPTGPVRITMPVDDRPRGIDMPIGNGTRLVEVGLSPEDPADERLLTAERPDPAAVARLLRRTAERTRALKAAPRPPLGRGGALLTAPVLPVGVRAAVARGLRRAVAPWTSTTLLSNIGRVPYPLDFGDAGRAQAVWFSAPARMPRGLTVTTAGTNGRLHLALRWSRALLDDDAAGTLAHLFEECLAATAACGSATDTTTGSPP
ncbi:condensation protein [Streptomyces sp. NPDC004647]|uniref:condensation protein n=1 Tax=Streptomyces sp. NPDC004647 TaxID=3154671 RepID=UPI0033BBA2A7